MSGKALSGREDNKEDCDGTSLDKCVPLFSNMQAGKCWRSYLAFLLGLTVVCVVLCSVSDIP
jgi:hypothetical protein